MRTGELIMFCSRNLRKPFTCRWRRPHKTRGNGPLKSLEPRATRDRVGAECAAAFGARGIRSSCSRIHAGVDEAYRVHAVGEAVLAQRRINDGSSFEEDTLLRSYACVSSRTQVLSVVTWLKEKIFRIKENASGIKRMLRTWEDLTSSRLTNIFEVFAAP